MAITLKNISSDGEPLEVTYLPEKGMNMISFKKGSIEVIDQSTMALFDERYAGLGALIGPHFHHRKTSALPVIKDESLFPHIARVKAKGVADPFSHGIARYAPWNAIATDNRVTAVLTGKDLWNGVALADLEGQNFKMKFAADLQPDGLYIDYSIVSDTDSLVGLHYYYHLPQGKGVVTSDVQPCKTAEERHLIYPLDQETDLNFHPFPDPLKGSILLDAIDYRLTVAYECQSQENSWQLYHPIGASFVCIEPLSSQDPRHPNLTVSSLKVHLQIH